MNALPSLFLNNAIATEIESICASAPEFIRAQQEFYKITEQIETLASPDLYDAFEKSLWTYLYRTANLYYLYGLGLRQDILRTLGTGG